MRNIEGWWGGRSSATQRRDGVGGVQWENTAAITRIELVTDGGHNYATGSWLQIIGVKSETVYTT